MSQHLFSPTCFRYFEYLPHSYQIRQLSYIDFGSINQRSYIVVCLLKTRWIEESSGICRITLGSWEHDYFDACATLLERCTELGKLKYVESAYAGPEPYLIIGWLLHHHQNMNTQSWWYTFPCLRISTEAGSTNDYGDVIYVYELRPLPFCTKTVHNHMYHFKLLMELVLCIYP